MANTRGVGPTKTKDAITTAEDTVAYSPWLETSYTTSQEEATC